MYPDPTGTGRAIGIGGVFFKSKENRQLGAWYSENLGIEQYPDLRIIFSHAGASMPFLIERLINLAKTSQYAAERPKGYVAEAAKFYYDTAQASNAAAMGAPRKVVPVSQIVFGTDYPFRTSEEHVRNLKECGVFKIQRSCARSSAIMH